MRLGKPHVNWDKVNMRTYRYQLNQLTRGDDMFLTNIVGHKALFERKVMQPRADRIIDIRQIINVRKHIRAKEGNDTPSKKKIL